MSTYILPDTLGRRDAPQDRSQVLRVDTSALSKVDATPVARALQYQANATLRAQESVIRSEMQITDAYQNFGKAMETTSNILYEKGEKESLLDAQQKSLDMQTDLNKFLYGDSENAGLYSRKGADALSINADFEEKFSQLKEQYSQGIEGKSASTAFDLDSKRLYNASLDNVGRYRNQEEKAYRQTLIDGQKAMSLNNIGTNYNNDEIYQQEIINVLNAEKAMALSEGMREGTDAFDIRMKKAESQAHRVRISGWISNENPTSIIKAKELSDQYFAENRLLFDDYQKIDGILKTAYPKAVGMQEYYNLKTYVPKTDEEMINWLIDEQEGGEKINFNEPRNAMAKYGINSEFLPLYNKKFGTDYKVMDLSRETAVEIYKKEFLATIDKLNVPENMRLAAFDTIVNHKFDKAVSMIKEAGSNPTLLMQLRAQEYKRLATQNPAEYADDYDGWMNRLSKLNRKMNGGQEPSFNQVSEAASRLDMQTPGAGSVLVGMYDQQIKANQEYKKIQTQSFLDRAMPALAAVNGHMNLAISSGALKPEDMQMMRELGEDVENKIKNYKGYTNPEYKIYLEAVDKTSPEFLNIDFNDPDVMLKLSPLDLQAYRTEQEEILRNPDKRNIAQFVSNRSAYYFERHGFVEFEKNAKGDMVPTKKTTDAMAQNYAQFKHDLSNDINNLYAIKQSAPTPQEMEAIAKNLVMQRIKQKNGLFTSSYKYQDITFNDLTESQISTIEAHLYDKLGQNIIIDQDMILDAYREMLLEKQFKRDLEAKRNSDKGLSSFALGGLTSMD